jgi:hypothetical protein
MGNMQQALTKATGKQTTTGYKKKESLQQHMRVTRLLKKTGPWKSLLASTGMATKVYPSFLATGWAM